MNNIDYIALNLYIDCFHRYAHSFDMKKIVKNEKGGKSERNQNLKKQNKERSNAFLDNQVQTLWFKFQITSSNGVDCIEGAYTNE